MLLFHSEKTTTNQAPSPDQIQAIVQIGETGLVK